MDQFRRILAGIILLGTCGFLADRAPAAAGQRPPLTPQEEQLASQINFDRDILQVIKGETDGPLHRLSGYDASGYQIMVNGLVVKVPHPQADQVRESLRNKLAPYACLVFFVELNSGAKRDRIGVIKGIDQFGILKVMQTHGDDDEVSLDDIVDTLRAWDRRYPFEIIGAENDWVEIEFRVLPKDLKAFGEEVYELSPDAVDEGPGTVKDLIAGLRSTKRLLLLWD